MIWDIFCFIFEFLCFLAIVIFICCFFMFITGHLSVGGSRGKSWKQQARNENNSKSSKWSKSDAKEFSNRIRK